MKKWRGVARDATKLLSRHCTCACTEHRKYKENFHSKQKRRCVNSAGTLFIYRPSILRVSSHLAKTYSSDSDILENALDAHVLDYEEDALHLDASEAGFVTNRPSFIYQNFQELIIQVTPKLPIVFTCSSHTYTYVFYHAYPVI